jgi:polyphosphate kinase
MEELIDSKETLYQLHIELVKLQREIIANNLKVLVILEGRDAAGKDGTIKRIVRHLSPRETRVVALGKPSDRQNIEWYFQRYTPHLPVEGEMVIFNRSWYNRAGVEKVMGFCTKKEYESFFPQVELFEKMLADDGFIILKYYIDISKKEQEKRLNDRKESPLKQWKISPIDAVALEHFADYSAARDAMLVKTNFRRSPWTVISGDQKKEARLGLITHLLKQISYPNKNESLLAYDYNNVFPVTTETIKDKVFND